MDAAVAFLGHEVVVHADLAVFLVIGLLAGAHCLGMCGPLVTVYGERIAAAGRRADELTVRAVRQHVLFNLGRTASYATLGGLFGLLGAAALVSVGATPLDDGLRAGIGILVGIAIIASGLTSLRGRTGAPSPSIPLVGPLLERLTAAALGRVDRLATGPGIVGLGAIHGLFPCPIIYPAYLYALALGDPVRGALALGVLGLGTIPALLAYGTVIGSLNVNTRLRLHRALGVSFLVLGYVPLQHGLMYAGVHLPHPPIPFYQPL